MASLMHLLLSMLVLSSVLTFSGQALAQQAIVRSNAVLRSEPSATATVEGQLHVGDKITLIDPARARLFTSSNDRWGKRLDIFETDQSAREPQ